MTAIRRLRSFATHRKLVCHFLLVNNVNLYHILCCFPFIANYWLNQIFAVDRRCLYSAHSLRIFYFPRNIVTRGICQDNVCPSVSPSVSPSVNPSVCLSHSWSMPKRLKISTNALHHNIKRCLWLREDKFRYLGFTRYNPNESVSHQLSTPKISPIIRHVSEIVQDRL